MPTPSRDGRHVYLITQSMVDQHFYNADGEMCSCRSKQFCASSRVRRIDAEPGEIVVIPRGVKFRVEILGGPARGYAWKITAAPLRCRSAARSAPTALPNARDFLTPVGPTRTRTPRPNCT